MTASLRHIMNCAKAEVEAQVRRLEQGIDPSEEMIYKVLLPQIRAKWSKHEEYKRRVTRSTSVVLRQHTRDPHVIHSLQEE